MRRRLALAVAALAVALGVGLSTAPSAAARRPPDDGIVCRWTVTGWVCTYPWVYA